MGEINFNLSELEKNDRAIDVALAESFVEKVYEDMNDIKHSFFRIGFRLHEAALHGYYSKLGYANITDLALDKFGFSKSTTYELIDIYELARKDNAPLQIAEKYDEYSQSQLRELCRLKYCSDDFMQIVSPSDIVDNIRKAVSFWNKYVSRHSSTPQVNNIAELLKLDIDTPVNEVRSYLEKKSKAESVQNSAYAEKLLSEFPGQLPGQTAIELDELTPEEDTNSAYAENSDEEEFEENDFEYYDEEEIEEFITRALTAPHSVKDGKFAVYYKYLNYLSPADNSISWENFVKFENFITAEFEKEYRIGALHCTVASRGLVIETADEIFTRLLGWSEVARRISDLIYDGEYLTDEEKTLYAEWKAEQDGLKISVAPKKNEAAELQKLNLKNKTARENWLNNFRDWGVWLEIPEVNKTFYRYDFVNGDALVVEVGTYYFDCYDGKRKKEGSLTRYSILTKDYPKFDSSGISFTLAIQWLTEHAKEI